MNQVEIRANIVAVSYFHLKVYIMALLVRVHFINILPKRKFTGLKLPPQI